MSGLYSDVLAVSKALAHLSDREHPDHGQDPWRIMYARDAALQLALRLVSVQHPGGGFEVGDRIAEHIVGLVRVKPHEPPSQLLANYEAGQWKQVYQHSVSGIAACELASFDKGFASSALAHGAGLVEMIEAQSDFMQHDPRFKAVVGGVEALKAMLDSPLGGYGRIVGMTDHQAGLLPAGPVKIVGVNSPGRLAQAQLHLLGHLEPGHFSPEVLATVVDTQSWVQRKVRMGDFNDRSGSGVGADDGAAMRKFRQAAPVTETGYVQAQNELIRRYLARSPFVPASGNESKVIMGLSERIIDHCYRIAERNVANRAWTQLGVKANPHAPCCRHQLLLQVGWG